MLFNQSLESHFRESLYKSTLDCPDVSQFLPLDSDKYIAISLLQKAIRRGEFGFAFSSALALLNINDRAFWKRMCVIVFEDIGIANLNLIGRVTIAAGNKRFRQKVGGDRIVAATLISEMCQSKKDRSTDDLLEFVEMAKALEQVKDDLVEMHLLERLERVTTNEQPFSHQSAAALAAAIGLPSDPQSSRNRIACSSAYFDTLVESGFDRTCVELSRLGLSRSGEALPIFMPLLKRLKDDERGTSNDDNFPPQTLIDGIPSWTYNGHTRIGLSAFREYINRSDKMREFLSDHSGRDLSKSRTVAALIFRLESGQMTKRLSWPTGNRIRSSIERLGWNIPDNAVEIGNQIILDEFDLLNECRATAAQHYLR